MSCARWRRVAVRLTAPYTGYVWEHSLSYGSSYKFDSVQVTGPNGYQKTYQLESIARTSATATRPKYEVLYVKSATDELGRTTQYQYEPVGFSHRLTGVTMPEGNQLLYEYDARGNIIKQTSKAKGLSLPDIVEEMAYNISACTGTIACWRPLWHKDAKGNQTDFEFNSLGQLTKQIDPADDQGVRRITTIQYQSKNTGSGNISRKSSEKICGGTGTTCTGANYSEVDYTYLGNTFLVSRETRKDPATGETRVTDYTYDTAGRVIEVDGPLAGTADTVFYRYDTSGRKTWEIGAQSPDGLRIATRTSYRDSDDKPLYAETGTLTSSTDTNLVVFQRVDYTYDSRRNAVREARSTGGSFLAVIDASYLDRGLPECVTVRMNPAVYNSLPASACTLGTSGSDGPDRITRNVYDAAGQLVQIRKAVGTAIEIADATYSYTNNGNREFVIDANGNKAEMRYDGFDRLSRWVLPSQSKPTSFNPASPATALATAGSLNESDYEAYGYDANGNRISVRKRDGSDIVYIYDNLNRMTVKDVDANNERTDLISNDRRDVFYSFDSNGFQISARFGSTSGAGIINVPDGFGKITTTTNTLLSGSPQLSYQYDKNGNVTRLTHPDSVQFDTAYDGLNRIATIKKGATTLVAPSYNDRGLLSGVTRYGSALGQSYGYDALSRLAGIDLGQGGSHSAKVGWDYTRNPASQIRTEQRDNDAYAWYERANSTLAYTTNGLNQYAQIGTTAHCYDANGNLTDDGVAVYKYDVENRLVEMRKRNITGCPSGANGYGGQQLAKLSYDPLGRLQEAMKFNGTTGATEKTSRFLYDGNAMVLEYNGSNAIVNRFVHGSNAEADDPLVWYEGSSTADTDVRNLYADPRGSIVLVMGDDGTTERINTYDEWGRNSATNLGRFQYTGQVWLDEIGMYYYKARIYSPAIGRFLQVDPIGYEDQFNLYAYAGNDPINGTDPTGSARVCTERTGSKMKDCVTVDADFDDNGSDDLSKSQLSRLGRHFKGSISRNKNRDFSEAGKEVQGNADLSDKAMTSVVSQFVGGSLSGDARTNWIQNVRAIWTEKPTYFGSAWWAADGDQSTGPLRTGRIVVGPNVGLFSGSVYNSPSDLARTLIHESLHSPPGPEIDHSAIDREARRLLRSSGLAGGGCSPVGLGFAGIGFPGC